ncbi:MAG: right-handed parallel beta-helix repeat-containing protein, partial [Candidatus Thorarchaeota archaeon]
MDIIGNFFQDCLYEGIGLTSCSNCFITSNTLSGTDQHIGQYGIAIRDSRECTLSLNNVTVFGSAIDITDGQLHSIIDNYVGGSWGGIILRGNDTTISNNEIDATGYCIQLRNSFRNIIELNDLHGSTFTNGIEVNGGGSTLVTENTVVNPEFGMRLQGTTSLEVSNNIFLDCYVAITFEELAYLGLEDGPSVNCRIVNNELFGCGLRFSITNVTGMNHEIAGNLIDGRPLAYLYDETNLQIDGTQYGQIILADCEDVTISGGVLDELLIMF